MSIKQEIPSWMLLNKRIPYLRAGMPNYGMQASDQTLKK
jgi:hypothetical protein